MNAPRKHPVRRSASPSAPSRVRDRGVPGLLLALLLWACVADAAAPSRRSPATTPDPTRANPRVTSLSNEPGYRPLVDPESSSVVAGRRLNAKPVSMPFTGGARSLDELGRAICNALHAGSRDSLLHLSVTDAEFRTILWPEFPQSRPVTGLQWDDAWKILHARLHAGCSQAVRDNGGHWYEFQRFEGDSVSQFRNFRLHSGLVLVAKNDAGGLERWRWLRSVAERRGSFKIYSTDD